MPDFERLLTRGAGWLYRYCLILAVPVVVVSVWAAYYAAGNLRVDADTAAMFPPELPFRQDRSEFFEEFKELDNVLLVVVETSAPEIGVEIARKLTERLRAEEGRISGVYYSGEDEFMVRHGLLFLEEDELEERADGLAEAQPFLAELMRDPSLRGLFGRLTDVVDVRGDFDFEAVDRFLEEVDEALRAALSDEPHLLSWQEFTQGEDPVDISRELVFVNPRMDFGRLVPSEGAIEAVRDVSEEILRDYPSAARVRLSGAVGLEYDEMWTARRGAIQAGILAFILVTLLLGVGLRSVRLIVASVATLLCGLALTAGIAAFLVGTLNMISLAFAVLYIGLGIDYAIHLSLHYRSMLAEGKGAKEALTLTLRRIGTALVLCTVSTALGFYVFLLTDFQGVSELGLIAGTGILVSLIVSLTLLPALLKSLPFRAPPAELTPPPGGKRERFLGLTQRHPEFIRGLAVIVVIVAFILVPKASFDYDPLNLRDQRSESVQTMLALAEEGGASPWTVDLLVSEDEQLVEKSERILAIPGVDRALSLVDFIPDDQEAKLEIISMMDLLLGGLFLVPPEELPPPDTGQQVGAMERFLATLEEAEIDDGIYRQVELSLRAFLGVLENVSTEARQQLIDRLDTSLLRTFDPAMENLRLALRAGPVGLDDLPQALRTRWMSEEGNYRIQVFPDPGQSQNELRELAYRIQGEFPHATGDLIVIISASEVVVTAFQDAFLYALAAIIVLLFLYTRSWRDTGLILLPLLLTALLTVAATVALRIPFNFANIIALPLLLGFGVDSGIHVVHRWRQLGPKEFLFRTSTVRAVFYSSLTTIFSFGNLAFSPHPGTASMGLVLTLGILFTLFSTLIVLPAFLSYSTEAVDGKIRAR